MKHMTALLLAFALLLGAGAALADEATAPAIDFDIEEATFLTQVTELLVNTQAYLGKTVALEGMMDEYFYPATGITYRTVYRNSPGCCGNDGYTGLEVIWDDPAATYPKKDEWVRAVGVLEQYEENDSPYLRLRLTSINVLDTRGLDFVTQ